MDVEVADDIDVDVVYSYRRSLGKHSSMGWHSGKPRVGRRRWADKGEAAGCIFCLGGSCENLTSIIGAVRMRDSYYWLDYSCNRCLSGFMIVYLRKDA